MATWDQMALGTWDQLYTWDDPDRDIAIDATMSMGEVTLDAAELTIDWIGDVPTDTISPTPARDEFAPQIIATDSFTRTVTAGVGATEQGSLYTASGGVPGDYNVDGTRLSVSVGALNQQRLVTLAGLTTLHSDVTLRWDFPVAPTGATGFVEHAFRARVLDASNYVDIRVFRNVDTGLCTVAVRQLQAGVQTTSSAVTIPGVTSTSSLYTRLICRGTSLEGYAWAATAVKPTTPLITLTGITWLTPGFFGWYTMLSSAITNGLPMIAYSDDLLMFSGDLTQTSVDHHPWTFRTLPDDSQRIAVTADGRATHRPEVVNTSSIALINDISEPDFDLLARVRATSLFAGGAGYFSLYARYQGTGDYLRFRLDFNIDQVMGYNVQRWAAGSPTTLASGLFPEFLHTIDGWIYFRAQGLGTVLRWKAWSASKRVPRDWVAYAEDTVYAGIPGKMGWGGYLDPANSNPLPYVEIQVDQFWMASNSILDAGAVSVGLSLDDGLPNEVTNTSNIGVNEASAALLGPIGTSPDIYFSTFRTDQPLADLPRDTAGVAITAQVLTSSGVRPVRVFTGRMTDIPLDDRSAKLTGVSSARLALAAPVLPPAVHGIFEGKEATWLISFILFKAGLYVAPRPVDGCRVYLPMNGMTHAFIPETNYQAAPFSSIRYKLVGSADYVPGSWIDGPFDGTAAPDLCINQTATRKIITGPGSLDYVAFGPGDDFWSKASSQGRIEAWVKGDPTNIAPSMNPSQGDLIRLRLHTGNAQRYVMVTISNERLLKFGGGDGTIERVSVLGDFPTDGRWHYIALTWDIANGIIKLRLDGKTVTFGTSLLVANLPARDDITGCDIDLALPTCQIRFVSGLNATKAGFANSSSFSPDVIMRRSLLQLEAVAETASRDGFEFLSTIAQGELAQLGFDEWDRVNYLPLSYWGETEQQLVKQILSTDSVLGRSFKATSDVHKIYNQITLGFKQTYVNENWVTGFQSSELLRIDPGQTIQITASMSVPVVEIRGLTFSVLQGAALAATPPSVTNAINYITLNLAQDGTSAYALPSDVTMSVVSWTPSSVTVSIRNNNPQTLYVTNNVSIPPFGIAVKQAISAVAAVTALQVNSIAQRGVRNLPVSLPVIQNPGNAAAIAQALVAFLAFPRTTIVSDVWGDFRRKPGWLVQVMDVDNTGLNGSFRLTGITTVQDGANVQQAISAVQAWRVQNWGSGTWGSGIWGES